MVSIFDVLQLIIMHYAVPLRTVFCLMGPTAIGKTDLALRLSETLPIEIISVDSALVYQHMNIGTAKPDKACLASVQHHLIDILKPDEQYSAGAFCRDALIAMEKIDCANKIPFLVGGTMMYFKSLQQGIVDAPSIPVDVRACLNEEWLKRGSEALYAELMCIDPPLAAKLHPNDQQRILRGLEVYRATGQCLSLFQKAIRKQELIRYINLIVLPRSRLKLQQRIDERFKGMLNKGFIEEVQGLRASYDLTASMNSMRAVGYRQAWQYLDGELNLTQLIEQGSAATRQLAKRQLTWLRSWPDGHVFEDEQPDLMLKLTETVQSYLTRDSV